MFDIRLSREAEKFYEEADEKLKARLKELFLVLVQNPVPAKTYDIKKIRGEEDMYRIRLSAHRAVYRIFWDEHVVRVAKIERRDEHTYE